MTAELHVLTGERAGVVVALSGAECTVGRHAGCTLRFSADAESGVSIRHARLAHGPSGWVLHDLASTNHTWLNGRRLDSPAVLRDGDRIVLGAGGPVLEVRLSGALPLAHGGRGRGRRREMRAVLAAAACIAGAALALGRPHAGAGAPRPPDPRPPAVPAPSAARSAVAVPAPILPRPAGPAALRPGPSAAPRARPSFPGPVRSASPRPTDMAAAERRGARNRLAVARIWVEGDDGEVVTGTAFSVRADGTLVTSRHVVRMEGGSARRIAVQFTSSTQVWRGRLVAVSAEWDLALVRIEGIVGEVPAVRGLNLRPDTLPAGAPVTIVGFPGSAAPRADQAARPVRSRAEFSAVRAGCCVEVHARSAAGASGSPVFDAEGKLLGVLFGGDPRGPRPLLFAVPAAAVSRLMAETP